MMTEIEYGATKIQIERENEEKLKRYPILEKQLEIAVNILQYYADEDIYDRRVQIVNGNTDWESEVMLDCGVKARHYLKKIEELNK